MKIIMLDLDTLRPDHLGCYGYSRDTSPALDSIAGDAMRFENYYCSDAPCLPSRAALSTGRFGIHNGAVNHGGTAADLRLCGKKREFHDSNLDNNLFFTLRRAGYDTASINSFAERHSSYWFNAGFQEIINCGKCGIERADEVIPSALDWLERKGEGENWFLHINMWDAHTPYRAPSEFGNPFEQEPMPAWITEEVLQEHLKHVGPHGLRELGMYTDVPPAEYPRQLGSAATLADVKRVFDGYDCGIRYMDGQIQKLLDFCKDKGWYDDMAILVTSDHGENIGELGIYSEHATADGITPHIPMLFKWPGMKAGVDREFHYQVDLAPTLAELLGVPACGSWDGASYAQTLRDGTPAGRPYLVLSQCAHVCQRAVRFERYIYIRTYHDGYHLFPTEMLFDLEHDPHEQKNLAQERPELCARACRLLTDWHQWAMLSSGSDIDPLWTVMREGGPYHARGSLPEYCKRLEETGRADGAARLRREHPEEF